PEIFTALGPGKCSAAWQTADRHISKDWVQQSLPAPVAAARLVTQLHLSWFENRQPVWEAALGLAVGESHRWTPERSDRELVRPGTRADRGAGRPAQTWGPAGSGRAGGWETRR